ncbi:MAG TPA: bifunctional 4-hydroxy-3-methylbut-2-enyl diphosphate reductase/30S ribosomal protein S1, partial [Nitrospirae bacterium]|nr:bifunctional 4-hydroxy-3-methylbut-2-enyl diphosphate reductase/30S ribosomal protein S1 [Nitrospirota bacterium]
MRIKLSGRSGFCFGVRRAITIAEKTLKDSRGRDDIYSFGPLIHNPHVISGLSKKGLKVIKDICTIKKGTVIISSHGAPMEVIEGL